MTVFLYLEKEAGIYAKKLKEDAKNIDRPNTSTIQHKSIADVLLTKNINKK